VVVQVVVRVGRHVATVGPEHRERHVRLPSAFAVILFERPAEIGAPMELEHALEPQAPGLRCVDRCHEGPDLRLEVGHVDAVRRGHVDERDVAPDQVLSRAGCCVRCHGAYS
jgi:hypothetical protein